MGTAEHQPYMSEAPAQRRIMDAYAVVEQCNSKEQALFMLDGLGNQQFADLKEQYNAISNREEYAAFCEQRHQFRQLQGLAKTIEAADTIAAGRVAYAFNQLTALEHQPAAPKAIIKLSPEVAAEKKTPWTLVADKLRGTAEVIKNKLPPETIRKIGGVALSATLFAANFGISYSAEPIAAHPQAVTAEALPPAPAVIETPAVEAIVEPVAEPAAELLTTKEVIVQPGDTLTILSQSHETTVEAIVAANPAEITDPDLIYAGATLDVPLSSEAEETPAPTPEAVPTPGLSPEQQALAEGDTQKLASILAERVLNHPNITINGSESGRVYRSVEDIVDDGKTFLYDVENDNKDEVPFHPLVLKTYLDIADAGIPIILTSLTTSYEHRNGSHHYEGRAGDADFISSADREAAKSLLRDEYEARYLDEFIDEGSHVHFSHHNVDLETLKEIFGMPPLAPVEQPAAEPAVETSPETPTPTATEEAWLSGDKYEWMRQAGIAESDWQYVDYIMSKESTWQPDAVNAGGCIGLGQNCPDKAGNLWLREACDNWQEDPACQLERFSQYAQERYGSWAKAHKAWTDQGWW